MASLFLGQWQLRPLAFFSCHSVILRLYSESLPLLISPGRTNLIVDRREDIDVNGQRQDTYSSTKEAVLVRKYFFMEYNRLLKNGRLDQLFDPSPD